MFKWADYIRIIGASLRKGWDRFTVGGSSSYYTDWRCMVAAVLCAQTTVSLVEC